jgi:Ferritin-like domain
MHVPILCISAAAITISSVHGIPLRPRNISDLNFGPIPSESSFYDDYRGTAPPFPANYTSPILATSSGAPGPDDNLFQNLLAAEWAIFNFYQKAVEVFNASTFIALGFPNTTYDRIQEIRDIEAGHMRVFQDSISNTSIKPGSCAYDFGYGSDPIDFLAKQTLIEVSSMVFAAGLVQQAKTNVTKGALVSIGESETRHAVWALIDIWNADPFGGPIETSYPYANQILDTTNQFIIPGSCPPENPIYPNPRQNLPQVFFANNTSGAPGGNITITYDNPENVPKFEEGRCYFAVFFHGLRNISMPFDTSTNSTVIPREFEEKGVILAVIADQEGAPAEESVLAGPLFLMQQPGQLVGSL